MNMDYKCRAKLQLLPIYRCSEIHCEYCEPYINVTNGRDLADPDAKVEIKALLKVRDFTSESWKIKGSKANRKNVTVTVDIENNQLLYKGEPYHICNLDDIMDGISKAIRNC